MGLQGAILFGVLMLRLFSKNENVNTLCITILLFDLAVILFVLLSGLKISIEDASAPNEVQKPVSEVNRKAMPKQTEPTKKSSTPKQINNKVPTPSTQQKVEKSEPKPVQEEKPQPTTQTDMSNKSVEEMTEADWEALFKMDDEE